jgi:hypothetical protein
MSAFYSIYVILDAPLNEKNITHIFQCGIDLGFIIYDKYDNPNDIYIKSLDNKQATSTLLKLLEADENDLYNAYFTVKFEDTDFSMRLDPDNGHMQLGIFALSFPWTRSVDDDNRTIDFARYIRLLLALCKDFSILEIKTTRDL